MVWNDGDRTLLRGETDKTDFSGPGTYRGLEVSSKMSGGLEVGKSKGTRKGSVAKLEPDAFLRLRSAPRSRREGPGCLNTLDTTVDAPEPWDWTIWVALGLLAKNEEKGKP